MTASGRPIVVRRRLDTAAVVTAAALGMLIARAIEAWALRDTPHVMDELAYALQARTFATGHLVAALRVPHAAFAMWFVDDRTSTYSIFPPGWPAVLALGEAMGARTWVGPALHGVATLLLSSAAGRLAGERTRVIAAWVYALCPQALLLAASLMSHALVAACAAAMLAGCVASRRRAWGALVAGTAIGVALLARPACAAALASGCAAFAVMAARRGNVGAGRVVALLSPVVVAVLLLGAYNRALTGHATRFPQSAWFDEHAPPLDDPNFRYAPGCNDLGFGPTHGCDYGIRNASHDARNALSNTGDNLRSWMLLAPGGPLALVAAAYALARRRGRSRLAAVGVPIVAVIVLYATYWYAGTCYGARFYHGALPSLALLACIGWVRARTRWPRAAAGCVLVAAAFSTVAALAASREVSRDYWGTDDRFARAARDWNHGRALALVAFTNDALPDRPSYRWTSFLREAEWRNTVRANAAIGVDSPDLAGDSVVFAKYHPALVGELRARFPDRALWLYVVEDDDARGDLVVPLDGSPLASWHADAPRPPDNFDAFVIPPGVQRELHAR
ncbi:MAG TPA: hypothetical protein VIF15_03810 [Polyangiaceae bacterium]|jgi:hypothetical protein